jgi:hypothetical protein
LVTQDHGKIAAVNETINGLGGPNAQVSQTPVLLTNDNNQMGQASLFQVKGADGQVHLVDGDGAKYDNITDYLESNRLDSSWKITRPANLGDPGASGQQLITGPAHVDTTWQKVGKIGDELARPMVATGSAAVMAAGAAELVSGGTATPVAAPVAGVGATMLAIGGGWLAVRGSTDLIDRYQHGRSISVFNPEAREDYVNPASGVGGVAARGVGALGMTRTAQASNQFAGGSLVAGDGAGLYHDWDQLSPQQRVERLGELSLRTGLLRRVRAPDESMNAGPSSGASYVKPRSQQSSSATEDSNLTSRAARHEAMRQQGIPTSQQFDRQLKTPAGHQYEYSVPGDAGKVTRKIVTDQTTDRVADHGPHWEAGPVKHPDEKDAEVDPLGRLRATNEKSKVNYKSGK